jgi:carbon-monoxide dehydrogenase large subunit
MSLIGQPLTRREDPPLLTGRGRYVDDFAPEGTLHAFAVRSPLAHARITGIDVTEARVAAGVAAVFTAADLAEQGVGPLPGGEGLPPGALNPAHPVLASDKVLWAGQPVVLVVAGTPEQAADAAELVVIDYDDLPAVTAALDAAADGAPVLHEGAPGNIAFRKRLTAGEAGTAFEQAAYRASQRMTSQRVAPVAMEPRGVLAYTAADGRLTVRLPTQRAHGSRNWLAKILGLPPAQIHVITGDVGGAFGAKGPIYPDQVAVIAAARALGRPVKWIEERSESFTATTHGRDQVADLELAADSSGHITAIRGTVHASFGAYFTPNGPGSLLGRLGPMLPQAYRLAHFDVELVGVFANTTPIGPYRGAGRPEAAYFTERLVDLLAREMGADPAELRRRNFIPPAAFPYTTLPASPTRPATITRAWTFWKKNSKTMRQNECGLPTPANSSAGASRRSLSQAASSPGRRARTARSATRPRSPSTRTARSPSPLARAATARATRPRSPSSPRTCSAWPTTT